MTDRILSPHLADPAQPIELMPIFRERVWGRDSLAPLFPDHPRNKRIGEIWYTFEENSTSLGENLGVVLRRHPAILGNAADLQHPGICPILVKLLFTSERLSVQVHPEDGYAQQHHASLGKTEAWYVVDAQPPAEVAVGFKQPITPERLKTSAENGEIEHLLDWRTVAAGDVIFTPAGTVHAIGAGLTICEVQENSDITYRLYDYGRGRELHLEHGARVSHLTPHSAQTKPVSLAAGRRELVACKYFRIEKLSPRTGFQIAGELPYYCIAICVHGPEAGKAWLIPAHGEGVSIQAPHSEWILTYAAPETSTRIAVD